MTDRDLLGRTLGEFVLCERIGEGGYGVVYRCEQPALRRQVVVKVLQRHDLVARERFLREAQLASRLEHPYAAHVYAFGAEDDGVLWIAMELVPGVTLKDWLEAHGPMPLEKFVPFFERVAEVVQAAHERGIVHRDLKPANMMVIERGEWLVPKLLDFGIAKVDDYTGLGWPDGSAGNGDGSGGQSHRGDIPTVGASGAPPPGEPTRTASEPLVAPHGPVGTEIGAGPRTSISPEQWLTRTGIGMGSRAYMSPEQWRDAASVGPASDIYSLGVVAYQALTGRVPFSAEQTREQFEHLQQAEVPPLGSGFPPEVDAVIRRALAKHPGDRQQSARELATALRAALRAQPSEQLRSLAQVWDVQARPAALLLKGGDLLHAKGETTGELGEVERAFVGASRRQARRRTHLQRVAVVAVLAVTAVLYRAHLNTQFEHRLAEQSITQAEIEQGRQALLHGESAEAQTHLWEAYQRGARTPDVEFMLARALQPRMAEKARFQATYGRMWSATFSPDGSRVVTADDRAAQVWDSRTYRLLLTLSHGDSVYEAVFSRDATRIVTVSRDGAVRIWDATTGELVRQLKYGNREGGSWDYFRVALGSNDRLVAAMDASGSVAHVWDAYTGTQLAELRNDSSDYPALAFSADGQWLATTGGSDIRVFDTSDWTNVFTSARVRVRALSFDLTGPRLLTGAFEGDAAIWAIPSGERIQHLRGIGEPIDAVAFSPNGKYVVTASRDGSEQVWNAETGGIRSQFNHFHGKVQSVEFDSRSAAVVSAGADGAIGVADAALGMSVTMLEGSSNIRVVHFDPSSRFVVAASWDGTARIWDATSPYQRWSSTPVSDHCGVVASIVPDRRFVAVPCRGLPTRIWDTARNELIGELPGVTSSNGDVGDSFPAVSTAGDRAAIMRDNTVEIFQLPGGERIRTVRHAATVKQVAFAPIGHDLVSGSIDGVVFVTRDGHAPIEFPRSPGSIDSVTLLADGRVVSSDSLYHLRIYDSVHEGLMRDLVSPSRAMLLRPSDKDDRLVTIANYTSADAPVLWDLESYRLIGRLAGHIGLVRSARFVDGGAKILTTGADGTVRMWDSVNGQLRQSYHGSARFLADATLDPGREMIVAGGGDGVLRFWNAETARALWTLNVHKSYVVGVHFEANDIVTRGFGGEVARWTLPNSRQIIERCGGDDATHERVGCTMPR